MNDSNSDIQQKQVPLDVYAKRLDQVLVELLPEFSRSRLQHWIKKGNVLVNGQVLKAKSRVNGGDQIQITIEPEEQGEWEAEDIPLDIVFEDQHILVLNKPAGLVVHPAAGNYTGTLLNALLYHCSELITVPRAGIVHRLDKDTSGLLVVAKTLKAQAHLVQQLQRRAFEREYEAIVVGEMTGGGSVDEAIGRHPTQRTKMAVVNRFRNSASRNHTSRNSTSGDDGFQSNGFQSNGFQSNGLQSNGSRSRGKEAITHYRIKQRYHGYTRLQVKLETGRTHQIRVHMAYIRHPLVGDPVYAGRFKLPAGQNEELKQFLHNFRRQALHARKLGLTHPDSEEWMSWEAAPPRDMQQLSQLLYDYSKEQIV